MSQEIRNEIFDIFTSAQSNRTSHKKLEKKLTKIFQKVNFDEFSSAFRAVLIISLSEREKTSAVENVLVFGAKFVVNLETPDDTLTDESKELNPLLSFVFDFLFAHHNVRDQNARSNVCYFLNLVINFMAEKDSSIDDSLWDKIVEIMKQRLSDKSPKVRVQAVRALQRFQDSKDANCSVIEMYIKLSVDPISEVRKAVLACMAKTNVTLQIALKRTRDIDQYVRKMAYEFISKVTVRSLTIKQREEILNDGLKDKSKIVRKTVSEILLQSWLDYFKGDHVALLRALDPEIGTEVALLALNVLLKRADTNTLLEQLPLDPETKLLPLDKLKSEIVLYWRSLVEFFHRESRTDEVELCLPELSKFCEYISSFMATMLPKEDDFCHLSEQQFVLHQLFEIVKEYDLSDENGREKLKTLMTDALMTNNCTTKLVEFIVKYYEIVVPNVDLRLNDLIQVISEIRLPTMQSTEVEAPITEEDERKKKFEIAKLRVELNNLEEEEFEAIKQRNFLKAQQIKERWNEIRKDLDDMCTRQPVMITPENNDDPETLIKCLTIVYHMICVNSVTKITPNLRSLLENLILPNLTHDDVLVYILTLKSIGVYCLLDQDIATKYIMMYFLELSVDEQCTDILVTSLQVIFDLLLCYGFEFFGIPQYDDKTVILEDGTNISSTLQSDANADDSKNLIKIIITLLDNQEEKLRTLAVEGLCKLLLHDRIAGAHLLSRLIISFHNPISKDDICLRQCLRGFFKLFVVQVSDSQEMLEQAFFPTLKTLANAPESSPLIRINPLHIAEFIIGLTSSKNHKPGFKSYTVHNNLAVSILAEALDPDSEINSEILIKALRSLDIRFEDKLLIDNVREAADKIIDSIEGTTKKKLMFVKCVKEFLNKITETPTDQI